MTLAFALATRSALIEAVTKVASWWASWWAKRFRRAWAFAGPVDRLLSQPANLRPPLFVEPTAAHTHTVLLLHGMYCEGDMFADVPEILDKIGGTAAGTRFIFPNAPLRTIDWPEGTEHGVSAWYNYFTNRGGTMEQDVLNEVHLAQVTRAIHAIIDNEAAKLGGDTRRIGLGGNSQGGTVALHAALTYPRPLGAVTCGCTVLLDVTQLPAAQPITLPVFVFTAEHDQEYLPSLQRACYDRLRTAGYTVTSHVEPGLDHYTTSIAENHHHAAWMSLSLHGKQLAVTHRDVPEAAGPVPSLFA